MTESMKIVARTTASPKEVHHALTDAATLRGWLAEHARVELPERYEFWGRYTPRGDVPRQRLLHVDDLTLRFAWTLDGVERTTEFALAEQDGGGTLITIAQEGIDPGLAEREEGVKNVLFTFWYLASANLVDLVEGRPVTGWCDFTDGDLRAEVEIAAPRERVYDALTDGEKATEWFGYPIGIEPFVGGRYAMGGLEDDHGGARIVDLEPGRRMGVDWGADMGVTTWELADSGGGTRLTFVQSGFDDGDQVFAGWCGSVSGLAELRRYLEFPDWRSIWVTA
ncbi:SRPBCC family protein [Actinocorallia populi]|uniref:SRPBCC family protein n=1 Tax=Actinocorallia populi TaxID=2079200 RepID=UPI000D092C1B|nr:SRPBCC domain-containing protein [Actinocorallia populi]